MIYLACKTPDFIVYNEVNIASILLQASTYWMKFFQKRSIFQGYLRMDGIYEHEIYIHKTPDKTLNSGDMVVNLKKKDILYV